LKSTWFDLSIEYRCPGIKKRAAKLRDLSGAERLRILLEEERQKTIAIRENSSGADRVLEQIEKSLNVDRARFADRVTDRKIPRCRSPPSGDRIPRSGICTSIASARLRAPNQKLLELARAQSEVIGKAKDSSPVEKPCLCRVLKLALAACLDVSFRCHRRMDSQHGNQEAGF